jgi:hypothetical protein
MELDVLGSHVREEGLKPKRRAFQENKRAEMDSSTRTNWTAFESDTA